MKEIKTVFDKFDLDEEKSNEIRSKLVSEKHVSHVWVIPVAAVLAAMVMIMVIPVTRNTVVNAAEKIFERFHLDMVMEVEVCLGLHGHEVDVGVGYFQSEDGDTYLDARAYFLEAFGHVVGETLQLAV